MTTFNFVQVNARNLSETIAQINACDFCVGFEVVNAQITPLLFSNFDPQHTGLNLSGYQYGLENISACKAVLRTIQNLEETNNPTVGIVVEKADIDAIAAATLYVNAKEIAPMEHGFPKEYAVFCKLCDRIKSINTIDCGIGNAGVEWNPEYYQSQQIKEVTEFNILGAMCSDFRLPLAEKVEAMKVWLLTGDLKHLVKYANQVSEEYLAQQDALISKVFGVTLVQSNARGATGMLYGEAPFGVCENDKFPIKEGTIKKFTVCEFTSGKYLDLQAILDDISRMETGWGGNLSAGVIGSPFGGTKLDYWTVCEIVAKHVL